MTNFNHIRAATAGKTRSPYAGLLDAVIFAIFGISFVLLNACPSLADDQLPVEWNGIDIGSAGPAASSSSSSGETFTVNGGGPGLGDRADAFHFVYQAYTGAFTITAHIKSINGDANTAAGGLMVREEMAANSNYVGISISPNHALSVGLRSLSSPSASIVQQTAAANADWLRLIKQGAVIYAFAAVGDDAKPGQWKPVGLAMPIANEMIFTGLFSTNGASASSAAATFDHVSIISGIPPIENGAYTIHPVSNTQVNLDGSGGTDQPVTIANSDAAGKQVWTITKKGDGFYSITLPGNPALALTVLNGSGIAGTKVILKPDTGLDTQLWSLVPNDGTTYNVYSKHNTGTGLDDFGGSPNPGPSIDLWTNITDDPHQQWTLTPSAQ